MSKERREHRFLPKKSTGLKLLFAVCGVLLAACGGVSVGGPPPEPTKEVYVNKCMSVEPGDGWNHLLDVEAGLNPYDPNVTNQLMTIIYNCGSLYDVYGHPISPTNPSACPTDGWRPYSVASQQILRPYDWVCIASGK